MSKKHFIAIAKDFKRQTDWLREQRDKQHALRDVSALDHELGTLRSLAKDLAYSFASFNGNFDQGRFLTACGF